jgi:cytoskeletal protein RodZ
MIGTILVTLLGSAASLGGIAALVFVPGLLPIALGFIAKLFSSVWAWVALVVLILCACIWVQTARLGDANKALATSQYLVKTLSADLAKQNAAVKALAAQSAKDTAAADKALAAAKAQRPKVVTRIERIREYPQVKPGVCHDAAIVDLAHKATQP